MGGATPPKSTLPMHWRLAAAIAGICLTPMPSHGSLPARSRSSIHPNASRSSRGDSGSQACAVVAMYARVPSATWGVTLGWPLRSVRGSAVPKSMRWSCSAPPGAWHTTMLSGFTSRWTKPAACRAQRRGTPWCASRRTVRGGSTPVLESTSDRTLGPRSLETRTYDSSLWQPYERGVCMWRPGWGLEWSARSVVYSVVTWYTVLRLLGCTLIATSCPLFFPSVHVPSKMVESAPVASMGPTRYLLRSSSTTSPGDTGQAAAFAPPAFLPPAALAAGLLELAVLSVMESVAPCTADFRAREGRSACTSATSDAREALRFVAEGAGGGAGEEP
mmetsp:Transcript_14524/g.33551  ORF Transcript_14524/g.33551 Transcript_14524/m.33551 type:complete len:332 (-) Transcript_14524:346-1341(-)